MMLFIVGFATGALACICYAQWSNYHGQKRMWQLIDDLKADNRALTESLCRAEGKPFISRSNEPLKESEGWFEAKPIIKVN